MSEAGIRPVRDAAIEEIRTDILRSYHHGQRVHVTLKYVHQVLKMLSGSEPTLLEAGCGWGLITEKVSELPLRALGIDLSGNRISYAHQFVPGARFLQGDLNRVPLRERTIHIVVLDEVIEHLHNPDRVLGELRRILIPEGYLILSTPSRSNLVDLILQPVVRLAQLDRYMLIKKWIVDWGLKARDAKALY